MLMFGQVHNRFGHHLKFSGDARKDGLGCHKEYDIKTDWKFLEQRVYDQRRLGGFVVLNVHSSYYYEPGTADGVPNSALDSDVQDGVNVGYELDRMKHRYGISSIIRSECRAD